MSNGVSRYPQQGVCVYEVEEKGGDEERRIDVSFHCVMLEG